MNGRPGRPSIPAGPAGRLTVLPSLRARPAAGGRVVLTRKFLDGLLGYARRWPGPVAAYMERCDGPDGNLDHVEVDPAGLPFALGWLEPSPAGLAEAVRGSAVALVSLVDKHTSVSALGARLGVPVVYLSEYSLRTRGQIIDAAEPRPWRRWRRRLWTRGLERRYVRALGSASGVQCNGTPTFEAYRALTPSPHLYFDTRVREDMVVGEAALAARLAVLRDGGPLRLVFSGRLTAMKGADHLPAVAAALTAAGVPYRLDIYGGGDQEPRLRAAIERLDLAGTVRLRGVVDFRRELVPLVASEADLFVCCHRQGDPSCTYLETMACGVPIAGYANEAFAGVARSASVGWCTPMDRPRDLAAAIARLHGARDELAGAAAAARRFALAHTFERVVEGRIAHLLACAAAGSSTRQAA